MPVRDQSAPHPPTKSRSGMFKWMISGHKGHKHKQEKLNNAVLNNKNKNNLKLQQQQQQQQQQEQQPEVPDEQHALQQQQQQQQQPNGPLHITETTNNNYNTANNVTNQVNGSSQQSQQSQQEQCNQQQSNGDVSQNVEKCDNTNNGLSGSIDNDKLPSPPASRPPPPPSHPPPPVPSLSQGLPQPPQQPLPPVPSQHEENTYQQERPLQAPGTCILPRRGLVREEATSRYRSPSNPPPASRQPPPYSRHQPPDPTRRPRGQYQPPPPPKIDSRECRDHWDSRGTRDICNSREMHERDSSRSRDRREPRDYSDSRDRHTQEKDSSDKWERHDFREPTYEPRERRESKHFHEILNSWERRESKDHPSLSRDDDHHRSSSLPRGNYDNWVSKANRWSSREPDSGFDSLNNPAIDMGPRSLDSTNGHPSQSVHVLSTNTDEVPYSQSTEDLLNASRTSPDSISSATVSHSSVSSSPVQYPTIRPAKQPCINGALHHSPHSHSSPHSSPHPSSGSPHVLGSPHHHSTPIVPPRPSSPEEALLSDSVYPQHDNQPRYAEIPDVMEPRRRDEQLNHRVSRDLRDMRDPREPRDIRESRESMRDTRELKSSKDQRDMRNSNEVRSNQDMRTTRGYRDTSIPRDIRDIRESRNVLEVREDRITHEVEPRGFRELSVDVDDHDVIEPRQERSRGRRDTRQYSIERSELSKEVRFSKDPSEGLRVRDAPTYDRRDRDADGADDLQVTEHQRGSISNTRDRVQQDCRRGDGATTSSVSWMEWTQQLQAYVAWVNSQLRKRGRPLISDLRRDLQSGVVFADLIEIISAGERVAGISREGNTVQSMRENLERILQFMAAKRIRMTHITSKEVAEGNLKSIMRIILALAAHYKPQSVKSSSASSAHQQEISSSSRVPAQPPSTHDVGVGPEPPVIPAEKTPNLSANRRAIITGGAADDPGAIVSLRRHPSMTATQGPTRESSPVYENLPRRSAPNRWAYDSLRPSHKFQWSGTQKHRAGHVPSVPPKPSLDESIDDAVNTSFNASVCTSVNTSLNTSLEGDVEVPSLRHDSSGARSATRPGALNFWQDLTTRRETSATPPEQPPSNTTQTSADDPDNPFRYHTIHRMSGRRKLPQIPGAPCPSGSQMTSPREDPESPRGGPGDSPAERISDDRSSNGGANDEGSREPEGRSQNSSPATSLIRGPTLDKWPREKKNPLDPWEQDDLKGVLRDLNNTRDQLLALQHLELDPSMRVSHGSRTQELVSETSASSKQEIFHLALARQALEAEKVELKRLLEQRENIITELRKQMHHRDKTIQAQRAQFEDALRNLQNGKRAVNVGDNPIGRSNGGGGGGAGGTREELQLVRDAIISLRSNFRGTDPNQHTLDTLEQAIAVLIERGGGQIGGGGGGGGSNGGSSSGVGNGVVSAHTEKTTRSNDKRPQVNGVVEQSTKVIYFTERTVTPFMSTINKRLGEIRLRDFKNMFDRPGLFRFHFKSHDPEYGMVKEEILSEDDILPGVEGKIIAWVEEDND